MGSRLLWRRSATAVGLYSAGALGIIGNIVAARGFSLVEFGLFATVLAATGFFQSLLDLTVEDSLTKYGFRYVVAEDWGRLRRLFRRALELKLAGGALAALALLALAPLAEWIFGSEDLALPLAIAAALPLVQAPENVATTALLLRGRYDLRAVAQSFTMGLRLVAIAVGVQLGLAETMAGIVLAQAVGTAVVSAVGDRGVSPVPSAPPAALAEDRRRRRRVRAPVERGDRSRLGSQRARAAAARHRRRNDPGRFLSDRSGAADGLQCRERPGAPDHAHRADARLGARPDRAGPGRRSPLHVDRARHRASSSCRRSGG